MLDSREIDLRDEQMEPGSLVVRDAAELRMIRHDQVVAVGHAMIDERHRRGIRELHRAAEFPLPDAHRARSQIGCAQHSVIAVCEVSLEQYDVGDTAQRQVFAPAVDMDAVRGSGGSQGRGRAMDALAAGIRKQQRAIPDRSQ